MINLARVAELLREIECSSYNFTNDEWECPYCASPSQHDPTCELKTCLDMIELYLEEGEPINESEV